jgi:hypothetical protein
LRAEFVTEDSRETGGDPEFEGVKRCDSSTEGRKGCRNYTKGDKVVPRDQDGMFEFW